KDPSAMDEAVHGTFAKLGGTRFVLDALDFRNDDRLFVPVSRLNQLRRELIGELDKTLDERLQSRIAQVQDAVGRIANPSHAQGPTRFRWSIKGDGGDSLDALVEGEVGEIDEFIIDIARDHPARLEQTAAAWGARLGHEKVRLALPALPRAWEDKGIRHKIR